MHVISRRPVLVLMLSVLPLACADSPTRPPTGEGTSVTLRGEMVSAIWKPNGETPSVRRFASDVFVHRPSKGAEYVADIKAVRDLPVGHHEPDAISGQALNFRFDPGSNNVGRKAFRVTQKPIEKRLTDGRLMRIYSFDHGQGRGHPAKRELVTVDGRPFLANEYSYTGNARTGWKIESVESTLLDGAGKPLLTQRHDVSKIAVARGPVLTSDNCGVMNRGLALGKSIFKLIQPNELYAAVTEEETDCLAEKIIYAGAVLAFGLATTFYYDTWAACGFTLGAACPGLLLAGTALTAAEMAMVGAKLDLDNCIQDLTQTRKDVQWFPDDGGGEDSQPGDTVIWCQITWNYITFNGGRTWILTSIEVWCPGA